MFGSVRAVRMKPFYSTVFHEPVHGFRFSFDSRLSRQDGGSKLQGALATLLAKEVAEGKAKEAEQLRLEAVAEKARQEVQWNCDLALFDK